MRHVVERYSHSVVRVLLWLVLAIFGATFVFAADVPQVELTSDGVAPRTIEDTTQQAVSRDYAKAWQALASAREHNRTDVLESTFVGIARHQIEQAVRDQQKSDIRVRYVDHGHKLQAIFYSQEGSALQLRDTASIETQVLDGESVLYSRDATVNYVVLMTPAADHWQVRMLQEVSGW